MAADLSRTSSKRRRPTLTQEDQDGSPKKQVRTSAALGTRLAKDATNAHEDMRKTLLKLFNAIEATLLSSLSLSNFHSIQQAVKATSRCDFEMPHLGQILAVWPGVYRIESSTALIRGTPVPTLSIAFPDDTLHVASSTTRRTEFERRLSTWSGQSAQLPLLQVHARMHINQDKVNSMRRPPQAESHNKTMSKSTSTSEPTAVRKDALLERLRLKALQRANLPSDEERKDATIMAMIPSAVQSIKILLASRRQKAIGMRELSDNLCTSLNDRMARTDVENMVEEMAKVPKYASWCKIGTVGDVKIVRFVGLPPIA